MSIGIIGAMKIEVQQIKELMNNVRIETISQIDFYHGELCGQDVIVAVSGIGKVNAAICTQTMILKYSPSIIINSGVAGGISNGIGICDVVIAKAVVQHDVDTSAFGDPFGFISGINIVEIPCSPNVVEHLIQASKGVEDIIVHTGIVATGDQFMNKIDDTKRIVDTFGAIAAEMEGGSIGQVCYINGVDFGIIRTISDSGDHLSNIDYGKFLEIAANKSVSLLMNFLKSMNN